MNVIAGILIGVANDDWLASLGICAIWALMFPLWRGITHVDDYVEHERALNRNHKIRGMSPKQRFYFVEFMTSICTTTPIALIAYAMKGLF